MRKHGFNEERGGVSFFKLLAGLSIIPVVALMIGLTMHGGWNRNQTSVAPLAVENKKEDPAASKAAAAKIAGYVHPEALIGVYDLDSKIYDANTVILDTRGRTYKIFQTSYLQGHIPGALPILHEQYCHPAYPERMATPLQLQDLLGKLGISDNSTIILYGNDGLQARVYWAVKMYGYDKVKILDGGIDKWKEAGYDITTATSGRPPEDFEFKFDKSNAALLATLNEVGAAVGDPNCVIVDARTKDEYSYKHIPGSLNLCFSELLNSDKTFKSSGDLKTLFESNKITQNKKVIVYSDSGVRSSLVWFALSELLGYPSVKNYDGSFNEWLELERQVESGG